MKIITKLFKPFILLFIFCGSYYANGQSKTIENEVFTIVESMPEFPSGKNAMHYFIANNLVYPEEAIDNKTEGRIYLNFIVETDGSISNIKILRGIGSGCDEEALRVVSLFPIWKPGMHKGQNVRVSYNLPFTFKLHTIDTNIILYSADTMSGFYGGTEALNLFIKNNLRYPITIINDKMIDTISVLFIVEKDGSISNTSLKEKKEVLTAYDFEALRLVRELPELKTAYDNGKAVRMALIQKVVFDYTTIDISNMDIVNENYSGNEYSYYFNNIKFTAVETMPEFPGGIGALYKFLKQNINYPIDSRNNGDQGRVYVSFVIESEGSVTNVKVLRGVSTLIDAEAIRIVKSMPKWSPGTQKGKSVRVSYNLPINFTLDNTDSSKKKKKRK